MNNLNSIGLIGLGVMGRALSENFLEKKISLSVYNRTTDGEEMVVSRFLKTNAEKKSLQGFGEFLPFVNSLKTPRNIILMLPSGKVIDSVINDLKPLLNPNDLIIDAGNSYFKDSIERGLDLKKTEIEFIDCGVSGGKKGARNGPSIMVGGSKDNYKRIKPFLKIISAKDENKIECCAHMGSLGSGHFVKMVHNGIEYGEMQILSETFSILNSQYNYPEIVSLFKKWSKKNLSSYLLDITMKIIEEEKPSGKHILDNIVDEALAKGTGLWSSISGLNLGQSNSIMISAVIARNLSSNKLMRKKNHIIRAHNKVPFVLKNTRKAFYMTKWINHYQGFEMLRQANTVYKWNIDLSETARIWTEGCIIKSALVKKISKILKQNENLFETYSVFKKISKNEKFLKKTLRHSIKNGLPLLSYSAAHNYWLSYTSESSNANLIQAQRDYFGNHGYKKLDDNSNALHHYNWSNLSK